MVRQKRGHSARFEVHHRNGKDQAERSEDISKSENQLLQEAVNYDPELQAPHKRLRYQLLDNGLLLISFSAVSDRRQFRTNQLRRGPPFPPDLPPARVA